MKSNSLKKYKAIEALVKNNPSYDEWSEAGMWNAVVKIVNDEVNDLSSKGIKKLMDDAKRY